MDYASWKTRTARGGLKPRSKFLKAVDLALQKYGRTPSPQAMEQLSHAFRTWVASKRGRTSIRNKDGAVDELNLMIEQALKLDKQARVTRTPRQKIIRHGGTGVFAEAAQKGSQKQAREDAARHRVKIGITQTLTYTPGMNYNKFNPTSGLWEDYVVPGPVSEDVEYGWDTKLDFILRGTVLEVIAHCAGKTGVSPKIASDWTTHIQAGWNNRARIVDNTAKRKYDIRFSLKWVPVGDHVYTIGLGDPPPAVQKTGAIFDLPSASGAYIYLSELRREALSAPDLSVFKQQRLSGQIGTLRYFTPTSTWKTTTALAQNTPELADLLRSINSSAQYQVKSLNTGKVEGPYEVKSLKMRALAAAGFLDAKTPVKCDGQHRFVRAEEEAELRGLLTPDTERKARAQELDTTVNTEVFGEYDRKAICHEFGHLIGNPDEYEITAISASTGQVHVPEIHNALRFTTQSIMNNPNVGFVEERHFYFILKQFREWQSRLRGESVSAEIQMNKIKVEDPVAKMTLNEVIALMLIRRRPPGMDAD